MTNFSGGDNLRWRLLIWILDCLVQVVSPGFCFNLGVKCLDIVDHASDQGEIIVFKYFISLHNLYSDDDLSYVTCILSLTLNKFMYEHYSFCIVSHNIEPC